MAAASSRRSAFALLAVSLLLVVAAYGCGALEEEATIGPDNSYRPTIRTATTRRTISKEASEEFDRAIAAARTSTTGGTAPSSTTNLSSKSSASSTSSTSLGGLSPAGSGNSVSADECKLFAQLINFESSIESLVDPADPAGTAERVARPVSQSKAGLDQLALVAPSDIRVDVQTVINWLRALAAAEEADHDAAKAAMDDIRPWFDAKCGG